MMQKDSNEYAVGVLHQVLEALRARSASPSTTEHVWHRTRSWGKWTTEEAAIRATVDMAAECDRLLADERALRGVCVRLDALLMRQVIEGLRQRLTAELSQVSANPFPPHHILLAAALEPLRRRLLSWTDPIDAILIEEAIRYTRAQGIWRHNHAAMVGAIRECLSSGACPPAGTMDEGAVTGSDQSAHVRNYLTRLRLRALRELNLPWHDDAVNLDPALPTVMSGALLVMPLYRRYHNVLELSNRPLDDEVIAAACDEISREAIWGHERSQLLVVASHLTREPQFVIERVLPRFTPTVFTPEEFGAYFQRLVPALRGDG